MQQLEVEKAHRIQLLNVFQAQEAEFSQRQNDQMRLVASQLKEQEDFILGIKLNLATLNKSHQEKISDLKHEKAKLRKSEDEN